MPIASGTKLGPYQVSSPLGAGGMGEVYRARDTRLGRDVAIKVLPADVAEDPRSLSMFESEARAVAALSHPNILALFDVGKEGAVSFVVTELLEGETLRELMTRGPLPLRRALDVGLQVAEGLAAAHGKGIVHRDVKPENVFLTRDGHAKVLDFGLARHDLSGGDPADTRSPTLAALSEKGVILGTVAYMSPEQARGEAVDFRTDQFSLGVVLYEMLGGTRPFEGASVAEMLAAIIRDEPKPLSRLAPKLPAPPVWVVERCLSKDPEERYSSTRDLAKELRNIRAHLSEGVSTTEVTRGETIPFRRRVPAWALASIATLAATLGIAIGARFMRSGSPPASPLSLTLSFPTDADPYTRNHNPFVLTPDGKTLVYVGTDTVGLKLFVRRLDRDEIRPIPGTEDAWFPFISPDGLQVGFFANDKLKKVLLDGGSPVTLCDAPNPRGGSWGADGTIVFAPSPMAGLHRIAAAGGEPKRVTTPDTAKVEKHYFPQILPDGDHVLFDNLDETRMSRASVVSLRTGEQRTLVEDAAYPRYLPTGHLVFARPGSLLAVPFSLKRLETAGSPVPILDDLVTNFNFMRCAEYAFSKEGTLVYLPTLDLHRTLVWVDRKGAMERTPFPPGGYDEVSLSPDGGRFATATLEKGEKRALQSGDFARGALSRSTAEGTVSYLAWTADGKRIAFGYEGKRIVPGAFWQSADGNAEPERLMREAAAQQEAPYSFSPDGSVLLIGVVNHANTGPSSKGWNIFALSLVGERKLIPFVQTKSPQVDARFSPDGKWVAYSSNESEHSGIFVVPFPGPGPRSQVSIETGCCPRWSRAGRELFYRQDNKVMIADVETRPAFFRASRPRVLFETAIGQSINDYDIAPDGTRFLMIKPDPAESGPAHAKVVLNWFEDVKSRVPGGK